MAQHKPAELLAIKISPWSAKTRWALQLLGIDFIETAYNMPPLYLAELPLRLRMGKLTGPISAPILFSYDGAGVIMDSFKIVVWAAAKKAPEKGSMLIPHEQINEVVKWNTLSNDLLQFGRGVSFGVLVSDQEARVHLGGGPGNAVFDMVLRSVIKRLAAKYAADRDITSDMVRRYSEAARAKLVQLRSALLEQGFSTNNTNVYILATGFSYADIAMAIAVDMLAPPSLPNSVAMPLAGMSPQLKALAEEFADLLAWREAIFRQHMPVASDAATVAGNDAAAVPAGADQHS